MLFGHPTPVTTGTGADETLIGGPGNDTFAGGGGADTFVINSGDSSATVAGSGNNGTVFGYDVITDFVAGTDLINVAVTPFAAGDTGGFDGIDSGLTIGGQTIKSDAISNGIITFSTSNSFSRR